MTRGIFLAGNESVLFSAVAAETEKRVEQYAAALIHGGNAAGSMAANASGSVTGGNANSVVKTGGGISGSSKGRIPLVWNPGSPVSNRTLILSAENWLGRINDALLVCSPPAMYKPAESLVPAEIETWINTQIKGWLYLVRELAVYFRAKGGGTLVLAIPETGSGGGESVSDLLGAPAAASFRAMACELLLSAAVEPFQILGFSFSEAGQEKDFAAWMFKILDEGSKKYSGKWHKYGKFPLFK